MKVYVFPADEYGCGFYRLIWPTQELIRRGHDVRLVLPRERHQMIAAEMDTRTNEPIRAIFPQDADVLVFQRVTHIHLAKVIGLIRQQGTAVVVDIDDDLSRIHPTNPAFVAMHPRNVKGGVSEHSWLGCELACRNATMVQASTPALVRRYAPHGRGGVVRNCIPESYLAVEHVDEASLGYGGSLHSHSNDVPVLGPSIARLQNEGFNLKVVGESIGFERALGLGREVIRLGAVDLPTWPLALTEMGVGVAPLADTDFNAAKSWLKMLEMAAVGVPCVGSPRAEYKEINKLGVGLLADRPKEWYRVLRRLLRDAGERADLAARGREVAAQWTIERRADQWLELWKEAYSLEQTSSVPVG